MHSLIDNKGIKLMQFTTKTALPAGEIVISHNSNIILAGSCFAGNIGNRLLERKFHVECNPFGIQYNPLSIATMLKRCATGEPFGHDSPELFEHNGMWHSMMHHSDFSRGSREELVTNMNDALLSAHKATKRCDVVVITFGTAYAYSRKSDGLVVSNCHKLPAKEFDRRLLGIEEITDAMGEVISTYRALNKDVRFLFTLSPIRHLRDGAHDNQKSKATLLLATDSIMARHEGCHYFPAYEIMLDELRDYRFYADDMVHPSNMAIEYIWNNFGECYFNDATRKLNSRIEDIVRGMGHRPFNAASEGHRAFLTGLIGKMEELEREHPYLNFEKEKRQCNTLLER